MTARGKHDHPYVQPIIVAKTGAHEPTVLAGAVASAQLYVEHPDLNVNDAWVWDEWLSGPFTKSVRRASYNEIDKVTAWADSNRIPWTRRSYPLPSSDTESVAVALPPFHYGELPKCVANLQVSGTDLPRLPATGDGETALGPLMHDPFNLPHLHVMVRDDLTTGKATAQAAHAVWAWLLAQRPEARVQWESDRYPTRVSFEAADVLPDLLAPSGNRPVYDAGLTEVEPDTLTALSISFTG